MSDPECARRIDVLEERARIMARTIAGLLAELAAEHRATVYWQRLALGRGARRGREGVGR